MEQTTTENKKGLLQNDKLLVCGMLAFYGFCILGLIAGAYVWLNDRANTQAANATATGVAIVTEQAKVTATAIAHATEQAQYDFIDRFEDDRNLWRINRQDSEYWRGVTRIANGTYIWEVRETKKTFVSWADLPKINYIEDFDTYVDTKILNTNPGDACSGFLFRVAPSGWDDGGYYFGLCNDSLVEISYHSEQAGWEKIKTCVYENYVDDWNRLEISARGSHFSFFINGEPVCEMDDDRRKGGKLALAIELNEKTPATFWFDNLGFQHR